MLLPVLLAAAAYGLAGGLAMALAGSLLIGPFMPLDVADATAQPLEHWLVRGGVFLMVGTVAGGLFDFLRQAARKQIRAARVDSTSGLLNQTALKHDLGVRIANPEAGTLAVVLVRATDLVELVDVIGIERADRVMGELGDHLQRVCPELRCVYRFSTSELACIARTRGHRELKRLARRVHDVAGTSMEVDDAPVRIEPALGIGHAGGEGEIQPQEYIRRARVALRRAISGESKWVTYEPALESSGGESMQLIARAEKALERGEFELHYQPKLTLDRREPAGAEALIRWRASDGLVAPGAFMPKLENTSLIQSFTQFVLRTATDFARSGILVPVSINFAPRNLADDTLVNELIKGLRETGTPPEHMEIEITESTLMREPETAIRLLSRLRDHGVGVSIDDFGTGYSSFAYLRRLPATNLKIDRAFIRPLEGDGKSRRLVLAMIEAAHSLDMSVTAEGVETEAQATILAELGCELGQGFLWSPALPGDELRAWLDRWRSTT
ncbi:GGDEF domain-containing protein [Wenzhouxiangella sp. XN201]|uniref:putative bifunctional diguanylate cyclase/phosphodiesterase n=1 Tax=Wenzhouxiangella sp. XN201 TaxID=2710755 RepID=UPI0013C6E280|nr:bifunctional diguanylate cyclase/phosphodiesterase [Wenzhouxiangella sp. XN201]NEZ02979.1 GGDEF domain-containing protein [Wenzhouxiangella sp. XN201]